MTKYFCLQRNLLHGNIDIYELKSDNENDALEEIDERGGWRNSLQQMLMSEEQVRIIIDKIGKAAEKKVCEVCACDIEGEVVMVDFDTRGNKCPVHRECYEKMMEKVDRYADC